MAQTKTFYLERGSVNPPELHPADEDELIKVYETNDDAMTDLANMDDNEVFATRDNDYLGAVIVDKVEDGNYNPLTSNAVFDYIQDQLGLATEEVVVNAMTTSTSYTAEYDGFITISNTASFTPSNAPNSISLHVNGTSRGCYTVTTSTYPAHWIGITAYVKKGDVITALGDEISAHTYSLSARYYKDRDYSNRT